MKKILLLLGVLLSLSASAQKVIILGDMNDDGDLTVDDVTLLTSTLLGERDVQQHRCKDLNGHEYVDLGLPSKTLWATCNIGATSPEDNGSYFAWAEVEPKSNYEWSTYRYAKYNSTSRTYTPSKYHTVASNELEPDDDAAYVLWGPAWRMPTIAQLNELRTNCTCTKATIHEKAGFLFTSKHNGATLFLPAAGYSNGTKVYNEGTDGIYYSRNNQAHLFGSQSGSFPEYADYLTIKDGTPSINHSTRYNGRTIRPVCIYPAE